MKQRCAKKRKGGKQYEAKEERKKNLGAAVVGGFINKERWDLPFTSLIIGALSRCRTIYHTATKVSNYLIDLLLNLAAICWRASAA